MAKDDKLNSWGRPKARDAGAGAFKTRAAKVLQTSIQDSGNFRTDVRMVGNTTVKTHTNQGMPWVETETPVTVEERKPEAYGFAFKRHDNDPPYALPPPPYWWDTEKTRDDVLIDISGSTVRARGSGRYNAGRRRSIKYGAWPCQETAKGRLFTISADQLFAGRTYPGTYPPPTRSFAHRRNGRADEVYPGAKKYFYEAGVAYYTGTDCFGAFLYMGSVFIVVFTGGYATASGPRLTYNSKAKYQLFRLTGGMKNAALSANRELVAEISVAGYETSHGMPGFFSMSPDGSVGMATFYNAPGASLFHTALYLRMSYSGGTYTATFSMVGIPAWALPERVPPDGPYILPYTEYQGSFDIVSYGGQWVPACVVKQLVELDPNPWAGVHTEKNDLVILVDLDFSGAFLTEAFRYTIQNGSTNTVYALIDINLQRGFIGVIEHTATTNKLYNYVVDLDLGGATIVLLDDAYRWGSNTYTESGKFNGTTDVLQTRGDYILYSRYSGYSPQQFSAILFIPVYDSVGAISGFTQMAVRDVPNMAKALGAGYLASDADEHVGLLGTV